MLHICINFFAFHIEQKGEELFQSKVTISVLANSLKRHYHFTKSSLPHPTHFFIHLLFVWFFNFFAKSKWRNVGQIVDLLPEVLHEKFCLACWKPLFEALFLLKKNQGETIHSYWHCLFSIIQPNQLITAIQCLLK